jgi:hypothetical protein
MEQRARVSLPAAMSSRLAIENYHIVEALPQAPATIGFSAHLSQCAVHRGPREPILWQIDSERIESSRDGVNYALLECDAVRLAIPDQQILIFRGRRPGSHVPYKSTTGIADPQRMKRC